MEVHHHTHHPKKWKEYFWEFFMLFLAVFCGFLAEIQVEHYVEHQREKQYMLSLVDDLESDTALLKEGFPRKDQRIIAIDSLLLFFETNPGAKAIPRNIFRLMGRSLWDRHYRRNNTTMTQLKNAGGLRLIRKKNVRDSIAALDLLWDRADFFKELYFKTQDRGKEFVQHIIQAEDAVSIYRRRPYFSPYRPAPDSVTIENIRINRELLSPYLNFLSDQANTTSQDKGTYEEIEKSAERLIALIKKEYHLE